MSTTTATDQALSERLFNASLAVFEVASVYLGDRLGLYRSLAEHGPATAAQLAERTETDERYVREWLEQQAVTGILTAVENGSDASRSFVLPDEHRGALIEPESLDLMSPLARMQAAALRRLPEIAEAYRTGVGVGWSAFGDDMRSGQGDFNRPAFTRLIGTSWLPSIPSVHARLQADPPARVADVACGEGWSTLAMARAYPKAQVIGVDIDEPSITAAQGHAAEAGMAGAVSFRSGDASGMSGGPYDLVTIFEAVHDMSQPVEVLRAIRGALADDGVVLVVDERVSEEFAAPGDEVERFMYGWSILVCLPDGRSSQPSAATGTVMRPETLRRYAAEAGFASVEILPIENDFFRFYLLRP